MLVTSTDVEWLTQCLRDSSDAALKVFYLSRFPMPCADGASTRLAAAGTEADPMGLAAQGTWTLPRLLWATRLISCDERALWECLGPHFGATFTSPVNAWNEQQAIKLTHYFLCERGRRTPEGPAAAVLEADLSAYAGSTIKPKDGGTVVVEASITTAAASAEAGCGQASVVSMVEGDAYSEGALTFSGPVSAFGELLRVPRQLMFFRDTVVEHCALGRVLATEPNFDSILANEEALLVLCFVYEYFLVGPARSHWTRLLCHCPPAYPTVPAFWRFGDLSELSGMDMIDEVVARRTQTMDFCDAIAPALPLLHEALRTVVDNGEPPERAAFESAFTLENVTFAKATFDSRAFNLHVDGEDVLALVPWADMVNHQNRTDVLIRRVEDDGGDFVMQVGAALEAGDAGRELWMSYGPLQNWELLQYYGFALPHNEYDQMPFPFMAATTTTEEEEEEEEDGESEEGNSSGRWPARRAALVARYGLGGVGRYWVGHSGAPCAALRALVRVHLAEADEFPVMERDGPFVQLSDATEARVVAAVADTADCVLALFPTTLEEDQRLLAELDAPAAEEECHPDLKSEKEEEEEDPHANDNLRLCLRVRMGVKVIAQRLHAWCAAAAAANGTS